MPRYVAFLRAINVGQRRVKMSELSRHFEVAGFADVKTHIASGNVLFTHASTDVAALERQIEELLQKALGYVVETFVRTGPELAAVAEQATALGGTRPGHHGVYVNFVTSSLTSAQREAVQSLNVEPDVVGFGAKEWIWVAMTSMANPAPLGTAKAARVLGVPSTGRNVMMLEKLLAKHQFDVE